MPFPSVLQLFCYLLVFAFLRESMSSYFPWKPALPIGFPSLSWLQGARPPKYQVARHLLHMITLLRHKTTMSVADLEVAAEEALPGLALYLLTGDDLDCDFLRDSSHTQGR